MFVNVSVYLEPDDHAFEETKPRAATPRTVRPHNSPSATRTDSKSACSRIGRENVAFLQQAKESLVELAVIQLWR
jgi:hypothetical protein